MLPFSVPSLPVFSLYNMCGYVWTECFLLSFTTFVSWICYCALDSLIPSFMVQKFFSFSFISCCILLHEFRLLRNHDFVKLISLNFLILGFVCLSVRF